MSNLKFYVCDTETTGLSSQHEINQISIIRFEDKFQKTINIKVEHPEKASRQALEIQGKTYADLKKGIDKRSAIKEINEFLTEDGLSPEHKCIVCHNRPFDMRFIHSTWESVGEVFPASLWLCSMEFARKYGKKQGIVKPKVNLAATLVMMGIPAKYGAHNAAVDSLNTAAILEKIINEKLGHIELIKRIPHEIKKIYKQAEAEEEENDEDPNIE
jgi:DNA polymerase III epsilon subunit-like protein